MAHSRSLCAVAPVVHGGGDAHHGGWDEVARQVVILPARELALKDLHQHEVELHTLQTHPGERGEEAEVEHAGDQGTHQLRGADGGDVLSWGGGHHLGLRRTYLLFTQRERLHLFLCSRSNIL